MTTEDRQRLIWDQDDMMIRMDIAAWMAMTDKQIADLAILVGVSKSTMYTRYRSPGTLSLAEARRLYQVIGKAAAVRKAV